MIALGTIYSVKICRGPSIPFRAGRTDASSAGPSGVPEPQQDIGSHIASFQNMGLIKEEMIGLVACGHTLGGVHEVDFPQTVHGAINSSNTEGMVHFDDSFDTFDNHMYVSLTHLLFYGTHPFLYPEPRSTYRTRRQTRWRSASMPQPTQMRESLLRMGTLPFALSLLITIASYLGAANSSDG
jgi:hypothetical protein